MSSIDDKTLALAGIFQAANLVQQIANNGKYDLNAYKASIHSIFNVDPKSTLDVFGELKNLKLGLNSVVILEKMKNKQHDMIRYALSLIHLEKKLSKHPELIEIISQGIQRASNQAEIFSYTHDNVIANLAGIYTDSISTFKFRINITGNQFYLTNTSNVNKIRALLLAGIRATVLWRQLGGNRWQLISNRKTIYNIAAKMLSEITTEEIIS